MEDRKLNGTRVSGLGDWRVVSSINRRPLMAAPNALLWGDLNHGWLRVSRPLQGLYG